MNSTPQYHDTVMQKRWNGAATQALLVTENDFSFRYWEKEFDESDNLPLLIIGFFDALHIYLERDNIYFLNLVRFLMNL